MKDIFKGYKTETNEVKVFYNDKDINELVNSESSFYNKQPNWGYEGGGPRQLAYAMLKIVAGDEVAKKYHIDFAREFTTRFPNNWEMSADEIKHWLNNKENNIVKKVCKELGITQKELAERLGVSKPTIERWAGGDIPEYGRKLLELYLENLTLKREMSELAKLLKLLDKIKGYGDSPHP